MMECKKIKQDFMAFLYGELQDDAQGFIKAHLESCPHCKTEIEKLKKVIKGADDFQEEIEKTMDSVDWENLPMQITESVFEKPASSPHKSLRERALHPFFLPKWKPAFSGLLLGVLIGSLVTFLLLRSPLSQETHAEAFFVSRDFLEKVELEMARRETLNYLEKSQYLLLDFIQSSSEKAAEFWQSEYASQKASDLLAMKKYINPQLDKFQMAKAKMICDQIEFLFFELAQISIDLSAEEIQKIKNMVEERQILMKIKLLKEELQRSEA